MVEIPHFLRKDPEPFVVTRRQWEILNGISNGMTHSEVEELLGMAYRTVESHLDRLSDRAGLHDRRHVGIKRAIASGIEGGQIVVLDTPSNLKLTRKERTVFGLLRSGLKPVEITDKLVLSQKTTERHLHNIYGKLRAKNHYHAFAKAVSYSRQEVAPRAVEPV